MNKPKLSVVIPAYNVSRYIDQCVESVFSQDYDDLEVIVVDDASTDSTPKILCKLQEAYPKLRIITHKENLGLTSARNSGVNSANGDYIVHLDGDDFWHGHASLKKVMTAVLSERCQVMQFNAVNVDASGNVFGNYSNKNFNEFINARYIDVSNSVIFRGVFRFIFEKEFLDKLGQKFDPEISIGEDAVYLTTVLTRVEKFSAIDEALYAYRQHDTSMMNTNFSHIQFNDVLKTNASCVSALSSHPHELKKYVRTRMLNRLPILYKKLISSNISIDFKRQFVKQYLYTLIPPVKMSIGIQLRLILTSINIFNAIINFIYQAPSEGTAAVFVKFLRLLSFLSSFKIVSIKNSAFGKMWKKKRFPLKSNIAPKYGAFTNIQGLEEFNVVLPQRALPLGISAMLRVKNEEKNLFQCVHSINWLFDEIVIINNNSSDRTLDEAIRCVEFFGSEKIKIFEYPFDVARCGSDNDETPELSVHSLAYYYNWCLEKCRYSWVCKWDADMRIELASGVDPLDKRVSLTEKFFFTDKKSKAFKIGVATKYLSQDGKSHCDPTEVNSEVRIFQNDGFHYFEKRSLFEALKIPSSTQIFTLNDPDIQFFELKRLDEDEFDHWSNNTFLSKRKVKEFRNYHFFKSLQRNNS